MNENGQSNDFLKLKLRNPQKALLPPPDPWVQRNVLAVVEAAGGKAEDITRITWYVTDKREYVAAQKEMGAIYR